MAQLFFFVGNNLISFFDLTVYFFSVSRRDLLGILFVAPNK